MVMNFFCTKNHLDEWFASADFNPTYYPMSLPDALAVSRMLFGE